MAVVGPHRRALQAVNGGLHLGQRYAIDFSARLDAAGRTHVGDADRNESYLNYGQPVVAVGDATVVEAVDGGTRVRIVYYRTMITEAVEFSFVNTDGMVFPLTFSVLSYEPHTFKWWGAGPAGFITGGEGGTGSVGFASRASCASRYCWRAAGAVV